MRILIIRHADPDYSIDSVTEAGKIEADLLAERLKKEQIQDFYVSPMGRAKRTLQPALEALGAKAQVLDWLEEFPSEVDVSKSDFLKQSYPDTPKNPDGSYEKRIFWDMLPSAWRNKSAYYDREAWRTLPMAQHSQMGWAYDRICDGFDSLMARYGYVREGGLYHTKQGCSATIALVGHFGMSTAILAHLWGVSPHILPHVICIAPTGVTELRTEEREKGIAILRTLKVGDISHLYAGGASPSFAARFCEVYENDWERH